LSIIEKLLYTLTLICLPAGSKNNSRKASLREAFMEGYKMEILNKIVLGLFLCGFWNQSFGADFSDGGQGCGGGGGAAAASGAVPPPASTVMLGTLDLDVIKEGLVKARPEIERAVGKSLVLVLGNTGAGKSTVINYLLGCKMRDERREDDGTPYALALGDAPARMGQAIGPSITFIPQLFTAEGQRLFPEIPVGISAGGGSATGATSSGETGCGSAAGGGLQGTASSGEAGSGGASSMGQAAVSSGVSSGAQQSVVGYYCDCPGFEDNRGEAHRVCASIFTEAVIHKADKVKVMVIIDESSMKTDRSRGIVEIGRTLGELFHLGLGETIPILFVVNKGDVVLRCQQLVTRIQKTIDLHSGTASGGGEFSPQDRERLLRMLSLMKREDGAYIRSIDIFDDTFGSAREIQDALAMLPLAEKRLFRFGFEGAHFRFSEAMRGVAMDMNAILKDMKELLGRVRHHEEQGRLSGEHVEHYRKLLSGEGGEAGERRVKALQEEIGRARALRDSNEKRVESIQKELEDIRGQRGRLDRDEEKVLWHDSVVEERFSILGLLSWTQKEFVYSSKTPISRSEEGFIDMKTFGGLLKAQCRSAAYVGARVGGAVGLVVGVAVIPETGPLAPIVGGAVGGVVGVAEGILQGVLGCAAETLHGLYSGSRGLLDSGAKGEFLPAGEKIRVEHTPDGPVYRYRSVYSSPRGMPGGASVILYARYNRFPDVVAQIQDFDKLLRDKSEMMSALRKEQMDHVAHITKVEVNMAAADEQQKRFFEGRQRHFENRRRVSENSLKAIQEKLLKVREEYEGKRPLVEAVYGIVKALPFDSSHVAVPQFLELYERLASGAGAGLDVGLPAGMTDPITLNPLIDPVQTTPCRHLFERSAIAAWLQTSRDHSCPVCRGPVEELVPVPQLGALVEEVIETRVRDGA
jgi:hypothetical protein